MTRIACTPVRRTLPGLLSAAGYVVAIPALLLRAAGWPLPRRLPSWSAVSAAFSGQWRPDDHFVISALAVIAWAVWAQIGAVTLSELRTIRSGRPGRTVPWSAWCRPIALRLAAALAMLAPLAPRAAGAAPVPISRAAAHAVVVSSAPAPLGQPPEVAASVAPVQVGTVVHIVRPDETLWDIARTQLGDPLRWRELFDLNRDRPQPDGRHLEDQDLLRPGWRVELPIHPPLTPESHNPATASSLSGPSAIGCSAAPSLPADAPAATPPTATQATAGPSSPDSPPVTANTPAPFLPASNNDGVTTTGDQDETVPSLGASAVARIGLPALTGGVLLGYLGGLRRDRERRRRRHHRFPATTAAQQAAERTVRAVARPDAPRWVDLALRHLASALAEDGAPPPPTLRAVLAGDAGVEVLVSPPWPVAPGRFLPQDDGQIWRLDPTLGVDELTTLTAGSPAYVPGVVTIGEADRGAVLIDLADAGSVLLEGHPQHTNAIAAAMAAELAAAPWSETCDVRLVGVAQELEPLERVQILPADTAVAELVRLAGHEARNGLADAAESDIPVALTIAVIGAGALLSDELAALVAAARPHSGLAVIAATPAASGVPGRFRLVCADGTALLYPLGLTVTPAEPHDISRQLVELLAATATASDVPLHADGTAPAEVESAEAPASDRNQDGEAPKADHLRASPMASDELPTTDAVPAANGSTQAPAMDDEDSEAPVTEAADAYMASDVVPSGVGRRAIEGESDGTGEPSGTEPDPVADAAGSANGQERRAPAPVAEVRLLGPIEVTWRRHTPKRQVAELVSYLSVHPRGVSTDEARLALWPTSADDDRFGERAPATFWALTTKARSALGNDGDGNPLLIREANNGWRLSAAVGCDWLEFQRLIGQARRDPSRANASLEAALRLVRGRPFQGSVFPWVEIERLDGVMEAAIADAAADLADAALECGDLATARFAVTQGLLGVPHAEALVRIAMRIAAAAGDRAGIERAWRDAQRIASELDPLGVPEPETAQLYESLRRKDRP